MMMMMMMMMDDGRQLGGALGGWMVMEHASCVPMRSHRRSTVLDQRVANQTSPSGLVVCRLQARRTL
jgi:hypothetical protein